VFNIHFVGIILTGLKVQENDSSANFVCRKQYYDLGILPFSLFLIPVNDFIFHSSTTAAAALKPSNVMEWIPLGNSFKGKNFKSR
jgi:hypothetical protein